MAENPDFSLKTLLAGTGVSRARFRRCFADKEKLLAALTGAEVTGLKEILVAAEPQALEAKLVVNGNSVPAPAAPQVDAWLERRLRVFERALAGLEKRQEKSETGLAQQLALIGERLEVLTATSALVTQLAAPPIQAPVAIEDVESKPEKAVPESAVPEVTLMHSEIPEAPKTAEPAVLAHVEEPAPEVVSEKEIHQFIAHARRAAKDAAANAEPAPPQRLKNLKWLAWSGAVLVTLLFCTGLMLAGGALGRSVPPPVAGSGVTHRMVAQNGVARLIALADSGDAMAQTLLAMDYLRGQGVASDQSAAMRWSAAAAAQGQPMAQYILGAIYLDDKSDLSAAVRWLTLSAEQGNLKAMHDLGIAYAQGLGVEKDAAEAVQWFARAAGQGYRDSEFDLAVMYERGEGVKQNARAALKWYMIAASRGDEPASTRAAMLKEQMQAGESKIAGAEAASFEPQPAGVSANAVPVL